MARPEFDALLARNPKARALSGEIRARVADSSKGMEEILAELANARHFVRSSSDGSALPEEALGEAQSELSPWSEQQLRDTGASGRRGRLRTGHDVTVNSTRCSIVRLLSCTTAGPYRHSTLTARRRPWSLFKLHARSARQCENADSTRPLQACHPLPACVDEKFVLGRSKNLSGHHDSSRTVGGRVCRICQSPSGKAVFPVQRHTSTRDEFA